MTSFAGDIEAGDRLTGGQVLTRQTDWHGGFAAHVVPASGAVVLNVWDEHPHDPSRIFFRTSDGVMYDLHRSKGVRLS